MMNLQKSSCRMADLSRTAYRAIVLQHPRKHTLATMHLRFKSVCPLCVVIRLILLFREADDIVHLEGERTEVQVDSQS